MHERTSRHAHREARAEHRAQRSASRADRREALLDAAVTAIRRDGRSVSMEAIAAEAGVTKPILYRHFTDREGLVHALADRFAGGLAAELEASLVDNRVREPRQQVSATIDAYLAFVERDPELYKFIEGRPEATSAVAGFITLVSRRIALALGEQLRDRKLDSAPAEVLAYGIVGMVHAAGDWWVEHRTLPRSYVVEQLTKLLSTGLEGMDR